MLRSQKGQEPPCSFRQPHWVLVLISCFSGRARAYGEKAQFLSPPTLWGVVLGDRRGLLEASGGWRPQTISGPRRPGFWEKLRLLVTKQAPCLPPGARSLSPCPPPLHGTGCWGGLRGRAQQGEALLLRGPHAFLMEREGARAPSCVCAHFLASLQVSGLGPLWCEDLFRWRHPLRAGGAEAGSLRVPETWGGVGNALGQEMELDGEARPAPSPA